MQSKAGCQPFCEKMSIHLHINRQGRQFFRDTVCPSSLMSGETLTITQEVQTITIEEGSTSGTFAFNTGNGYLCAASSSANQLKTHNDNDANSSCNITISDDGTASVIATGSYTRNVMQYNPNTSGTPLFACYASASQKALAIYKKSCTNKVTLSTGSETNATINSITPTEIQTCSDNAAERQVVRENHGGQIVLCA